MSDLWVVLAEGRFPNRQRALKERLGPDQVPVKQVMKTEHVQTPGDVWVGAPEHRLP